MDKGILCCLIKQPPPWLLLLHPSFTDVLIKINLNLMKAEWLLACFPLRNLGHSCFLPTWSPGSIKFVRIENFPEHLSAAVGTSQFQKERREVVKAEGGKACRYNLLKSFLAKTVPSSAETFVRRNGNKAFRHSHSAPDPEERRLNCSLEASVGLQMGTHTSFYLCLRKWLSLCRSVSL